MNCALPECPHEVKRPVTGRPRKYCSARCANCARKRAQRERGRVSVTVAEMSRKSPAIHFYCGLNEKYWNHHPVEPGPQVCIAPVTGRKAGAGGKRETSVLINPAKVQQVLVDSAGPCVEPARNGKWGYGSWTNPSYRVAPVLESCKVVNERGEKAPTCSPETICRGLERGRHVALTRSYLAQFREREPALIGPHPHLSKQRDAVPCSDVKGVWYV